MDLNVVNLREINLEIEELNARKAAIKKAAIEHRDTITDEELANNLKEVEEINNKITQLEEKRSSLHKEERKVSMNLHENGIKVFEERANQFVANGSVKIPAAEVRDLLLGSGGIVQGTKIGEIKEGFPTVVTLVDKVNIVPAEGCGAYQFSVEKSKLTAGTREDGKAGTTSDAGFYSVSVTPTTINVTTYVSKKFTKGPNSQYFERVIKQVIPALKARLVECIVHGYSTFKGIKTSVTDVDTVNKTAVPLYEKMYVNSSTIDENTLSNIILNYGGENNVYGGVGLLLLTKEDLKAFGKVRGADKKAVYTITPDKGNPNIGTIQDGGMYCEYCIVPSLTSLSKSTVPTEANVEIDTMIYGIPTAFDLTLFSDYVVETSKDEKFSQGLIAIMGEVEAGGTISVPRGFSIVTLKKASA